MDSLRTRPGRTRPSRWRHQAAAFAIAALTAVTAPLAAAVPASAVTGTPLISADSGRCLDVANHTGTAGNAAQIWDCNGGTSQGWTFTSAGELRDFDGTMCLDAYGRQTTPGTRVVIWTCTGGTNQRWTLNADGTVKGTQSGLCLNVTGAADANGTAVVLATCNASANQRWTKGTTGTTDTQPPTVPGNPRSSDLTCSSVTLSWNASTDNVGVTAYDVYHDGQLVKSVSGTTLSTSLTVVPLVTWGWYVNARDAAGNVSQGSATVSVTPPACQNDTQAPTAPGNLRGTASGTSVTLTWTASTDNVGVKNYEIYRNGTRVGSGTGTTFNDSGLAQSTAYTYYVVALDAAGNVSPHSSEVRVTTGGSCTNPVCGVTEVASEPDLPWGLLTLPNGDILYSRRDVHDIMRLNPATGAKTNIGAVPNVDDTNGEGGLMGLAISPNFSTDNWLYMMHTSPTDNRIVRIKYVNGMLDTSTEQILVTGILRNKYHNGGRLRWGPDGKLYASAGDAQNGDNAQNLNSLNGKILRINPDGTVPSDNPFGNYVWSYGHRNPQGIAFDSQGRLWEQEFGNNVMDETNLITKGGNYGWPACEGTTGSCANAGYIAPVRTYPVAEGSCSGLTVVRDVVYIACERSERMYRAVISGNTLTNVTQHFQGTYGRLRTVEPAPDGGLWLTTSAGDKDGIPNNSNAKILKVTLGG
ncbi:PQQ-dependent sugar dehydrogenase [Microbispora sp. NPDC049125]|uniref:PQQ-dependent sugar dehydrogenase n=1 Tax=Microbispora sp. NPDC049125 TaxID=3154929 RepID=UPI003467D8C0